MKALLLRVYASAPELLEAPKWTQGCPGYFSTEASCLTETLSFLTSFGTVEAST